MLYRFRNKNFKHHVHPTLQRRIRLFILMSAVMMLIAGADLANGTLSPLMAIAGITVGTLVGFASSRIFNLTWDRDGNHVVGSIDIIGWIVLGLYIVFEIARASIFQIVFHSGSSTAVTFVFVGSALIARVLGMRGKIVQILKAERVFE